MTAVQLAMSARTLLGLVAVIVSLGLVHGQNEVRDAMTQYWKDNSKDASMEEMMLDDHASELSKDELPEILSYLPDWSNKDVIDLGAGIGRYTSEFAKTAKSVVAVDFMEDFITKNKETNNHMGNIEFCVADVTKFERPKESVDLIFSNWLLMYLTDQETEEFFRKQLVFLRPGGYLFIRESCRHQSGNKARPSVNPTRYRHPELYESFYSTTTLPCDDNNFYGFDLVVSKSVDTYIKKKNNSNQIIWLIQKVKKGKHKTEL